MTNYSHQIEILNPAELVWPVNLVGLGGIGSAVALTLAKLGVPHLRLWDDDRVEEVNLPSQLLYRPIDLGQTKVEAAAKILKDYGVPKIEVFPTRVENEKSIEGIVVAGVDSMASRRIIWEAVRWNVEVPLYLDGRLGGEMLSLFTVRPSQIEDVDRYERSLFDDGEAAELPCGARAIIHPAVVLAGLVANQLTRWIKREPYYEEVSLAFRTMHLLTWNQISLVAV